VPSAATWRLSGLPRALEPEHGRGLHDPCDRQTTAECRHFTMLTALVRLSLRAGEVAALQLDDIDWRPGELVVADKGRRSERCRSPLMSARR
jgi:integrase